VLRGNEKAKSTENSTSSTAIELQLLEGLQKGVKKLLIEKYEWFSVGN
jgi:hypothetical protein